MIELDDLLKPSWSATKWLENAWLILEEAEQAHIQQRLDTMFFNEIPFLLQEDKIFYLHLFSLFTQLEIFALQGMLKSLEKLEGSTLYARMRQQITDEFFHAIIFARLTYQFSAPYAFPPASHPSIEKLMSLIMNEADLQTSFALINLVAEGWIEELFLAMSAHNIAACVFDVIILDESRHIEEADLYLQMGFPDKKYLSKKIMAVEEELITMIFSQKESATALIHLIGTEGLIQLAHNIDKKHRAMLKKLQFTPSQNWQFFMQSLPDFVNDNLHNHKRDRVIEKTTTRKLLSSLWADPDHPTESAVFTINISQVHFYEKKFPPETITCLFLQTLSRLFENNPHLKNYLSYQTIFQPKNSYIGLAVHFPEAGDHLGLIEFENCHRMSLPELAFYIQDSMKIMAYCRDKTEQLKKEHPYLLDILNEILEARRSDAHQNPMLPRALVSLSNIGHWGYESAISPLFPNETVKVTLCKIDKKQVWNPKTGLFEIQDLLPVAVSVDHRVFDANIPIPKLMQAEFDTLFLAMQSTLQQGFVKPATHLDAFIKHSDELLDNDIEFGFRYLLLLSQHYKHERSKLATKVKLEAIV